MGVSERWKPVPGFEGLYEVSDLGRIKSIERVSIYKNGRRGQPVKEKIRKTPLVSGYPSLFLSKDGEKTFFYVHTLVAECFIGPRPEGNEVAHYDGQKVNCTIDNLRYATPLENDADKIRHGTRPEGTRNGHAVLTEYDIVVIRSRVAAGEMQKTVAADYGVRSSGLMSQIINRKIWRHI